MTNRLHLFFSLVLIVFISACSNQLVSNKDELKNAISALNAGDTLIINNGTWKDVVLNIDNTGTADAPIVIMAKEAGKVKFTGNSRVSIGGQYIELSGILFTDGDSGKKAVVSFKSKKGVAHNCRLTNCAIVNYNPSDRFLKNDWVQLYGKQNKVDYCSFVGKLNAGLAAVVKLNGEENQNNEHVIANNYFGERKRLGSNGGETIRVGTSTFSLTSSKTKIVNNYFEHCNGEVEIISIKSCDNIIDGNTFYECEGVLTLRHGNRNTLTNNVFIGNNKPHTGGIRVINAGHIIKNNHFQELAGTRFRSAFGVMNGVPNSAINRYFQVKDVNIEENVFVNCKNIAFGVGTDNERTATPENVTFKNNIIANSIDQSVFKALDDISGITFENNCFQTNGGNFKHKGFVKKNLEFKKNEQGIFENEEYKANVTATKENTGARWLHLTKNSEKNTKTIKVTDNKGLANAIERAEDGDLLELVGGETYIITEPLKIDKSLAIKSNGDKNAVIKYETNKKKSTLFLLKNGGSLNLKSIDIDGSAKDGIALTGIKTQDKPCIDHYTFVAEGCNFYNFNEGRATCYKVSKSTYADSIVFENCTFSNISGMAINLKAELEDKGKYNVENVVIKNCLFANIMGSALELYRGGNDESTLGPFLTIDQCTFHNIENRELGSAINLTGVQWVSITNCIFSESGKSGRVIKMEDQKWIYSHIDNCNFYNTGRFESYYDNRLGKNIWKLNPQYKNVDALDFSLKTTSPLLKKSTSGKPLGYLK